MTCSDEAAVPVGDDRIDLDEVDLAAERDGGTLIRALSGRGGRALRGPENQSDGKGHDEQSGSAGHMA